MRQRSFSVPAPGRSPGNRRLDLIHGELGFEVQILIQPRFEHQLQHILGEQRAFDAVAIELHFPKPAYPPMNSMRRAGTTSLDRLLVSDASNGRISRSPSLPPISFPEPILQPIETMMLYW